MDGEKRGEEARLLWIFTRWEFFGVWGWAVEERVGVVRFVYL